LNCFKVPRACPWISIKYFLAKHCNIEREIQTIYKKEEIDQLGINGAISIAEVAGYLKKDK